MLLNILLTVLALQVVFKEWDLQFLLHQLRISSSVTRKGATHTRKESDFRSSVDMETKGSEDERGW